MGLLALAVGRTIAGNLMMLAAARNVMITSGRTGRLHLEFQEFCLDRSDIDDSPNAGLCRVS